MSTGHNNTVRFIVQNILNKEAQLLLRNPRDASVSVAPFTYEQQGFYILSVVNSVR